MPVPEIEEPVSSHISSPTPAAAGHPSYYFLSCMSTKFCQLRTL